MTRFEIPENLIDAIVAYSLDTASDAQRTAVQLWLEESASNRAFLQRLASDELKGMLIKYGAYDTEQALAHLKSKLSVKRRRRTVLRRITLTAGVAACLLMTLILITTEKRTEMPVEVITGISRPIEDISFVIGDKLVSIPQNAEITIREDGSATLSGSDLEGIGQLDVRSLTTHKLIVPRGRRSNITLPDGSKVMLNSGTELEFPPTFGPDQRRIKVKGEVFIEAAHDPDRPFYIEAGEMTVMVVGTQFNISCYPNDTQNSVVLVQGSVEVSIRGERCDMTPGQMLVVREDSTLLLETDVEQYICWKDGYLLLPEKVQVLDVLAKIEQYYNVDFSNDEHGDREALAGHTCYGKLILWDDVEDVIESICLISGTTYEREGDIIRIKSKLSN